MSARIVEAINAMILHSDKITSVVLVDNEEYIFCYKDKYIWGIRKEPESSHFSLFYFPKWTSTSKLATALEYEDVTFVSYSSNEIGTPEVRSSMAELLTIVQEKLYGLDEVLDDIISDPPF